MIPITYLFVPGDRPERFSKALDSGADRVIVDLEDAVLPVDKDKARTAIGNWIDTLEPTLRQRVLVRINDARSPFHTPDLDWITAHAVLHVMLSKCESSAQVAAVHARMPQHGWVLPLIESARGVAAAAQIAAANHVGRLAFGALDYQLDLDLPGPGFAVDTAASALVLASRVADLPAPVAGVTPELDVARVSADLQHARALGFGAKMCIHPMQVAAVREGMRPDAAALRWARRITRAWNSADGAGAVLVDGMMVDKPVLLRAQRILALADQTP